MVPFLVILSLSFLCSSGIFFASDVFAGALEPGKPVKIYILDSGFNPNEALNIPQKDLILHDTFGGSNGISTAYKDHGTAMVQEYYKKLAPEIQQGKVELHIVKVEKNSPRSFDDKAVERALALARDNGAHIINLSMGSAEETINSPSRKYRKDILDDLQKSGTIIVASAGNDGDRLLGRDYVTDFSTHLGVISVGGLDPAKNNQEIIDYSSGSMTGRVDVYATTVTENGGTSTATAYTGATIAKEFVGGRLNASFDYDGDGKLRGREVISFLSSPQFSDKANVVGADEAAYKSLLITGWEYDEQKNQFFLINKEGKRKYVVPEHIGIYDQPSVIAQRMKDYGIAPYPWMSNKNLYRDIGLAPFWEGVNDPSAQMSKDLFRMSVELSSHGWNYDRDTGEFWITYDNEILGERQTSFKFDDVKKFDKDSFCEWMRAEKLLTVGYSFMLDERIIVEYSKECGGPESCKAPCTSKNGRCILPCVKKTNGDCLTKQDLRDPVMYKFLLLRKGHVGKRNVPFVENSEVCATNRQDTQTLSAQNDDSASQDGTVQSPAENSGGGTAAGSGAVTGVGGSGVADTGNALVNCGKSGQPSCTMCDLIAGIHGIVQWLVKIMIVVALVIITVAGIMYIVSAGGSLTNTAVGAIKYTLIGVTVVLVAFLAITFLLNRVFDVDTKLLEKGGLQGVGSHAWNFSCIATPTGGETSR